MTVGIGITTHNRTALFLEGLAAHRTHLPPGAVLVIVDDASADPIPEATFRFEQNVGIARAKNKAMELLIDAGCEHLFLFDDDTWPAADGWHAPYVESDQPHLMYLWGAPLYRGDDLVAHTHPKGCMLYVHRSVIETVGGMDPRFGVWGHEHASWSDRIHNAGLTRFRYQDVPGPDGRFHACDEAGVIESSVPERVRQAANSTLYESKRDSSEYIDIREEEPVTDPETQIALSILVPSVHTRRGTFGPKIQEQLFGQWEALPEQDRDRVEILMLTDTKSMMLGHKRNVMVDLAQGRYVQFVDDDDRLEPDMIKSVLAAIDESGADVITFLVSVSMDGHAPKICRYSIKYDADYNTRTEYHRLPNHICVVRRAIAERCSFPNLLYKEDEGYSKLLKPLLKTEHQIDRVLYHYDYSTTTTETQLNVRYQHQIARRTQPPVVDVVILSKATTAEFRKMTQKTVDTCVAGANGLPVNVVVLEQAEGVTYRGAITVPAPGEFHYNRFANRGASSGSAPWIMIANNDLTFENGWLHHLLAAKHPLVSPHNPGDRRQAGIVRNETGVINGRHLSGWCYMIDRTLWERIGGFDEDVSFWCSDDAVIEQVIAVGVRPMLVPKARVRHLMSKTLKTEADVDESMTWGQVAIFNAKYGRDKFTDDARFIAWKQQHQVPA